MTLTAKDVRKGSLVAVAIVLCFLLIIPYLAWPWHLVYGSNIEVSGVTFSVPPKYFFSDSDQGGHRSMIRYGLGFPFWHANYGFIGIYPHPKGPEIDLDVDLSRIELAIVEQKRLEGLSLVNQRTMKTPVGAAACFEFESEKNSAVGCFIDHTTLTVDYDGARRFTGDLYEVMGSARRKGPGEERQR